MWSGEDIEAFVNYEPQACLDKLKTSDVYREKWIRFMYHYAYHIRDRKDITSVEGRMEGDVYVKDPTSLFKKLTASDEALALMNFVNHHDVWDKRWDKRHERNDEIHTRGSGKWSRNAQQGMKEEAMVFYKRALTLCEDIREDGLFWHRLCEESVIWYKHEGRDELNRRATKASDSKKRSGGNKGTDSAAIMMPPLKKITLQTRSADNYQDVTEL